MLKTANCSLLFLSVAAPAWIVSTDRSASAGLPVSWENRVTVGSFRLPAQMLRIMRMLSFLLVVACLSTHANSLAQNVTISGKDMTLKQVFAAIEKQTGYVVFHKQGLLADSKTVTLTVYDMPLSDLLHAVLKDQALEFVFEGKTIIISRKPEARSNGLSLLRGAPESPPGLPIRGIVRNVNGEPVAGANIVVKGTKNGVSAGSDGSFTINVNVGDVLVISSIGFSEVTIKLTSNTTAVVVSSDRQSSSGTDDDANTTGGGANDRNGRFLKVGSSLTLGPTGFSITLSRSDSKLDEVQVIAYGTTTKRLSTGNISSVKAKDIQNSPVNNPILAIAGRVPGITINQSSGFAGSGVDIQIQGMNSLQKGNTPFYVIDGVPYTQMLLPNLGYVWGTSGSRGTGEGPVTGNPLSYINPGDIESIEILKDADATAIYGSRAANGAIIITTKSAKVGKIQVQVNAQSGFGEVGRKLKLLSTSEYIQMRKEAKSNDNTPIRPSDYDLNGTWDSTKYTNWQGKLIGNKARFTDLQIGFSGGNSNVQFLFGANYHKETTVLPTSLGDQKASGRLSINASSNDKRFQFVMSAFYLIDDNRLPVTDFTLQAVSLPPNMPDLLTADGQINWAKNANGVSTITSNPMAGLSAYYYNKTKNLITNSSLSYKVTEDLEIKSTFGYNSLLSDELLTSPISALRPEFRPFVESTADYGNNNINSWIIEPQINYQKKLNIGSFAFLVGSTIQEKSSNRRQLHGTGYVNDAVLDNIGAAKSVTVPSNTTVITNYKYAAVFANLNYNFEDRYILNITGRRDGSSRFGPKSRLHNFGAVGAAWIFSNENFMTAFSKVLSYGKIKASYGTTGNDQIGEYAYLSLYDNLTTDQAYRGSNSLIVNRLTNPYLQWEETKKLSAGIDLGFLDDRILLNATYYRNTSSNMLVGTPLPSTVGPGGLTINLPATIRNFGWEFSISSVNVKAGKFRWTTDANLTIPHNKLVSFPDLQNSGYSNAYIIDEPVNIVKAYKANGVNQTTGIYEFLDKDGKIVKNPGTDPLNYNQIIDPNPKFYGGISNALSYNGISLSFLFQFDKRMAKNIPLSSPPGWFPNNQQHNVLNRWRSIGDDVPIQKYASSNFEPFIAFTNQLTGSDAYWENAAYVRLKNISLSYSLPLNIVKRLSFQTISIFVTGQNLLTFTSFSGLDPETRSNFTLPPLRVLTAGIRANL